MPSLPLFTYQDAVDHGVDLLGSTVTGDSTRDARRAARAAYQEFSTVRRWVYYYQRGQIITSASQSDGTVDYNSTTRVLTLTGSTWPSWAAYGTVAIARVPYEVAARLSSTTLQLSVNSNPGVDVASGTAYTFYRDTYPMPGDFLASDQLISIGTSIALPRYVHPSMWLSPQQLQVSPATPRAYTFMADPNYMGVLAVRFNPAPDQAYTFNFIYQRRPRPLVIDEYKAGTVTGSSTTLTGTGTAWTSKMIGSVLRLYSDGTQYPTGLIGAYPYTTERIITAVASTTSLTLDTALDESYTAVKYTISDPCDIEDGAMLVAFQRCIEKQNSLTRNMKADQKEEMNKAYMTALTFAMEADCRNFERRVAGSGGYGPLALKYYPSGADVS